MKRNLLARGNLFIAYFFAAFLIFNCAALKKACAVMTLSLPEDPAAQKSTRTLISLRTTGPVEFFQRTHSNPSRLTIFFNPGSIYACLREKIDVNRGMVKQIWCSYYPSDSGGTQWVRAIEFILLEQTSYDIARNEEGILVSFLNIPEASKNGSGDLVISEVVPGGWGTAERSNAIKDAVDSVMLTKVSAAIVSRKSAAGRVEAVPEEKELSPTEMILAGARALIINTVSENTPAAPEAKQAGDGPALKKEAAEMARLEVNKRRPSKLPRALVIYKGVASGISKTLSGFLREDGPDFFQASLGLACLLLGVFVVDQRMKRRRAMPAEKEDACGMAVPAPATAAVIAAPAPQEAVDEKTERKTHSPADNRRAIEEMFLKDDELSSFNFKPVTEIVERRKYPRADLRTSRGVLARALVGSKTQPFKKIRINDISRGGLSFIVGSKDAEFKTPTMIKLYFADSSRPVDLWVRVVWEKQEFGGGGKRVGVKFTKVPKETWSAIMGAFGHKLG